MKKILFISHALPPYLYPQSIQVGRFLIALKKEYDVYVVGAEENTPIDPTLYPEAFFGIPAEKILRIPYSYNPYVGYIKSRLLPLLSKCPDLYAGWSNAAYAKIVKKFPDIRFDAIITFSFPLSLNLLGGRLKEYYKCSWIAHQSDPWADNPFMHYGPVTRVINQRLESSAFQAANRIIYTNQEAQKFFQKKYPEHSQKISYVDHSFDEDLFPQNLESHASKKIIRYIGNFYGCRTARPLLNAIEQLSEKAKQALKFEIVGGSLKTKMLLKKAELPDDLISVKGRVNYHESLVLMKESDALLVIDAPVAQDNIFFPSKLADYIGSQKPIIGISSPGPTSRILQELGYPCFLHDQIDGLADVFEKIAEGNANFSAPPKGVLDHYKMEFNARKLMGLIEDA